MKYSYVFALSGPPVPRLVERIRSAVNAGHRVAVAYLKRPGAGVKIGDFQGTDIFPIKVPFRAAGIDRVFSLPRIFYKLNSEILKYATRDAFVYVDSLDIIAALCFCMRCRQFSVRYEVRDLHRYQLSSGPISLMVRIAERLLIRRVDRLILTSEAYFEYYYKSFYRGPVTLLENLPDLDIWADFQPKRSKHPAPITIGVVGAIRYTECILSLVEGARLARKNGVDVRLKIVGPDMEGKLKIDTTDQWIERSGPFDYVNEIRSIYSDLDIIWCVYDTRIKNVRLALPNKLYESLLSRIPIVVAQGTFLSECVYKKGIGIAVDGQSADSIAEALCSVPTGQWYRLACEKLDAAGEQNQKLADQHYIAEHQALFYR